MDGPSEWCLLARCSSCVRDLAPASTAVLLRETWIGPRGVVLDALGERWPEPGQLFHPSCFLRLVGRGPLWAAFIRGRFDKGVARPSRWSPAAPRSTPRPTGAAWTLTVACCGCGRLVETSNAAVVRGERTRDQWQWVPALEERRPGQRQVCHLHCFVKTYGRPAAYAALGREAWERIGPLVKKVGGAINPNPF